MGETASVVGVLNLDKPSGLTSTAALARLKRSSGERRVGHGGTLDPQASGVLPVFLGRATVLASCLSGASKEYVATVRFGFTSETDDADGALQPGPAGAESFSAADVVAALARFTGAIEQRPPAFSAIKLNGRRSYRIARSLPRGESPVLAPRAVMVHSAELRSFDPGPSPAATIHVHCGPGFYVRALARDLGEALGVGAYLQCLVRTRVGPLLLEAAVPLDAAVELGGDIAKQLLTPLAVLGDFGLVDVPDARIADLRHGRAVPALGVPEGDAGARDPGGRLLAVGVVRAGLFRPRRLVEL